MSGKLALTFTKTQQFDFALTLADIWRAATEDKADDFELNSGVNSSEKKLKDTDSSRKQIQLIKIFEYNLL